MAMMEPYTELMVAKGFNISNEGIMLWFHQENEDQVKCYLQKS